VNKGTLKTAQFHQGNVLYAEGRAIYGETIDIWGKDTIIAVKEGTIKRYALTGTLDMH
jgi:hypothetical protein